jgi:hypothetical protein
MKKIKETCAECGSDNLWQGYDVMLPLKMVHDDTLTLNEYSDGSFNEYIVCMNCDADEPETIVEEVDVLDMEATYCEGCGVLCIADLCTDCLPKEESFPCNECDCEYGDGSCSDCIEIQRAEGRYEELWEDEDA